MATTDTVHQFDSRALQIYEDAKKIGYVANRFRQKILRDGGVAAAKQWLKPKATPTSGFRRLLDHERLDLSVEAVVLQDPWSSLFTDAELETARSRLGQSGYFDHAPEPSPTPPSSTPDELIEPQSFPEGTREQITVNAYERDPKARDLCIQHFGVSCYVCEFDFEESYGELGRNFIHVHHLTPFSTASGERTTDPRMDLRPVCPNCHAMLHRTTPPMPIGELKRLLADRRRSKA